jgi:hypothetical protein
MSNEVIEIKLEMTIKVKSNGIDPEHIKDVLGDAALGIIEEHHLVNCAVVDGVAPEVEDYAINVFFVDGKDNEG